MVAELDPSVRRLSSLVFSSSVESEELISSGSVGSERWSGGMGDEAGAVELEGGGVRAGKAGEDDKNAVETEGGGVKGVRASS